jgi:Protein of unknown function (DUF3999)
VKRSVSLSFLVMLLCALAPAANPEPEIQYFKQVRDVSIGASDRQNYFVMDTSIWNHARPDLADLRLFDGGSQVPYQLTSAIASITASEVEAKILNLAQHGDHTEFDLDISPVTEYNRIRLAIDRKDFLITASVAGSDALASGSGTPWPSPSTLFDFSREHLGSNAIIALPLWTFRFVHVRLSPGILPKEVKQAIVAYTRERKAFWTNVGTCHSAGESNHSTVFSCEVPSAIPIDRVQFEVPAARVNFRRPVSVQDERGMQLAAGSISRIRMNRAGTTAIAEDLTLNVFGDYTGRLTITIDNGDDPPLAIDKVQPQSVERRIYFEPQGKTSLKLYYGDDKLTAPVYDYAKLFREDANAAQAQLGAEGANAAYTNRPDERPWSERHKSVLWAAMLLAVAVLGTLAFRGLKTEGQKAD